MEMFLSKGKVFTRQLKQFSYTDTQTAEVEIIVRKKMYSERQNHRSGVGTLTPTST